MARAAAIAWALAAILIAGLASYLASEEPNACAADPAAAVACAPPPVGEAFATIVLWSFLVPVWAPSLLAAYLMARNPSRALAIVVAVGGIVGGVAVASAIVLLAHPGGPPSWDTPWLAFALLLAGPGTVSALAAREIGHWGGGDRRANRGEPATAIG